MTEEREYDRYLKSDAWKRVRESVLERDEHKCRFCGATENLRVHHKAYQNVYEEECALIDLITLCDKCHKELHDYLNGEVGQKTKIAVEETINKHSEALKQEIMDIVIDSFAKPLKNKKHICLYTYMMSFWEIIMRRCNKIYFGFSAQNTYCEMKKRGLIK